MQPFNCRVNVINMRYVVYRMFLNEALKNKVCCIW